MKGNKNRFLGIDSGSISMEVCLIDEDGVIRKTAMTEVRGSPLSALARCLEEILNTIDEPFVKNICVTGSGRSFLSRQLNCDYVNEISAHAEGTATVIPENTVASIIEVGGQDSKFIRVKKTAGHVEVIEHCLNTLCAAGTGAFLDGLAESLGVTTTHMAEIAARAESSVHIAGRCAVFSRSDLIHLKQKGVPVDVIAYSICLAAARNISSNLIRNRKLDDVVYFTGGVAGNRGMVRAIREILGLRSPYPIVPENHTMFGAIGAAIKSLNNIENKKDKTISYNIEEVLRKIKQRKGGPLHTSYCIPGFDRTSKPGKFSSPIRKASISAVRDCRVYAGIDIGSTSIKWAITDGEGKIFDYLYTFAGSNPVSVLSHSIEKLKSSTVFASGRVNTATICATGSGRKLASILLGNIPTVNEVTAMVLAARKLSSDVDTIFEIGGQDAKFVKLKGGVIGEFVLNTACSAGTGSILLQQASRMGISIEEMDRIACGSETVYMIHPRCSVFMDSDLVSGIQSGRKVEALAAGISAAVALNYIERVVGRRRFGREAVFLGGVSRMESVRVFLEKQSGIKVKSPWWGFISGAVGASFYAREKKDAECFKQVEIARLKVPDIVLNPEQFFCSGCGGSCGITVVEVESDNGKRSKRRRRLYIGGGCGRYDRLNRDEDTGEKNIDGLTPWNIRVERFENQIKQRQAKGAEIGVPFAHQFYEISIFVTELLSRIGISWGFSSRTNLQIIQRGEQSAPAQHCMPLKVAIGHCKALADDGVKYIFLPQLTNIGLYGKSLYPCVYTQQLAAFVKSAIGESLKKKGIKILSPSISIARESIEESAENILKCFSKHGIDLSSEDVRGAVAEAVHAYERFKNSLGRSGMWAILNSTRQRPSIVLFGRAYSIYDSSLNLQLPRRIEKLGALVVPFDTISRWGCGGKGEAKEERIPWLAGYELVSAAHVVKKFRNVHPVVLTFYGCGVDGFMMSRIKAIIGEERPMLEVELDGHGAEAGIETRLEAFMDQITTIYHRKSSIYVVKPSSPEVTGKENDNSLLKAMRKKVVAIPFFAPHVYPFAGAFERAGVEVVLLPPPDEAVREVGERYSCGRECNPFFYLLGDLLKWAKSSDVEDEKKGFFIPSSEGACLLSQYGPTLVGAIKRAGCGYVEIFTPTGGEIMRFFSIEEKKQLWIGLLAADYLHRWKWYIRVFSRDKGRIDSIFNQSMHLLRKGVREGKVLAAVQRIAEIVKTCTRQTELNSNEKVKIGIIGDIYTRMNQFANQNLYNFLERLGCQILAPPFMVDLLLYDMNILPLRLYKKGKLFEAVKRGVLSVYQWSMWNYVRSLFPSMSEIYMDGTSVWGPGYQWKKQSSRFLNVEIEGLLAQNIGKSFDYVAAGADGIINVMCHGCMIGTSTEAVLLDFSKASGDIPVLSLSYDSLGDIHTTTRIEAFVEVVAGRKKTRGNKKY